MAMIQCGECGKKISDAAASCPHCGAPYSGQAYYQKAKKTNANSRRTNWAILGIVIVIIGFFIFFSGIPGIFHPLSVFSSASNSTQKTGVTLANFNSVETGMSYTEVCLIFGSNGSLLSQVDIDTAEAKTEIYMWNGSGNLGANCNVTFQGDKVVGKAQFGLE